MKMTDKKEEKERSEKSEPLADPFLVHADVAKPIRGERSVRVELEKTIEPPSHSKMLDFFKGGIERELATSEDAKSLTSHSDIDRVLTYLRTMFDIRIHFNAVDSKKLLHISNKLKRHEIHIDAAIMEIFFIVSRVVNRSLARIDRIEITDFKPPEAFKTKGKTEDVNEAKSFKTPEELLESFK